MKNGNLNIEPTDSSEVKSTEDTKRLLDCATLLQSIVESIPIRIFWKDIHLRFLGCNTLFANDAGLSSPKELIGKSDFEMTWCEQAELYNADDQQVIDSGISKINYEEAQTTPDGHHIWVRTSKVPLYNSDGSTLGILGIYDDITTQKEIQKELKLKEEMMLAQSKQAAMGDMLAMIAHQWRQPLAAMGMEANSIRASIELEEEITKEYLLEYTQSISAQIQNLSKMIDDFRSFFKPDQAKEQIKIEDALTGTINMIGTSLKNSNIALTIQNTSKSSLLINKSSLIQVLLNIIGNAKEILLEREVAQAAINITVNETQEAITLYICDNGGGISEDIMDKLGHPYFTTKQKFNGAGLGLYISKTIVEKHLSGLLSWHNEKEGACFVIVLKK